MARGCDISEWQGVLPPEWFEQWDFVIMRAHSGYRYDKVFGQNWKNATGRTQRGIYVFQVGDNDATWQAQSAIDIVSFLGVGEPEIGYWSDAENNPDGATVNAGQVEEFLNHIAGQGKKVGGYYCSLGATQWTLAQNLQRFDWWMAAYGNNDGSMHQQNPPRSWVIYQYTSNPLDTNFADDAYIKTDTDPVLYAGSPNWMAICDWQKFLKIPVTGTWDDFMTGKVRDWQAFMGFQEEYPQGNPVISKKSWDTRRFLESQPHEPETANGNPIIYKGSPNWLAVCDWQTFLKIPITGTFDDAMAKSLSDWQSLFGFSEEYPAGNVITGEKSWATRGFLESQPSTPPVEPPVDPPVDPPLDPPVEPEKIARFDQEDIALIVDALRGVARPTRKTVRAFKKALEGII